MKNISKKLDVNKKESKETLKRYMEMYDILINNSMSVQSITDELSAKGHLIDERSVQRDLKALQGFKGLMSQRDPTHARRLLWSVDTLDFTSPGNLDDAGALAIVTAQKQLELASPPQVTASLKDAFKRASQILSQLDSEASRWHQRVRVVNPSHWLRQPEINEDVFDCIRSAVLHNDVVELKYKAHSNDEPSEKMGTGLGLYYRGPVAYFIIFNHNSKKVENYPLSRIFSAKTLITETKQGVEEFDMEHFEKTGYLAYRYGEPFKLKAMIFDSVRREITEAHLGENQVISPIAGNEKFQLLEVDVPYTLNLIQWLLARAPYLKVLGPSEFKAKFEEEIKRAFYNVDNKEPDVPKEKNFLT